MSRAVSESRWGWVVSTGACLAVAVAGCAQPAPAEVAVHLPVVPDRDPIIGNDDGPPAVPNGNRGCEELRPGAASVRLLTRLQYDNTVRDLLGDETRPAEGFPAESILHGFGNNADGHRASLLLTEGHLAAAQRLATEAVARGVDALLPCSEADRSAACRESFVSDFGYRAFRRPLTAEEATPFLELFQNASAEWGFDEALALVIQAFLQSPQMLYRTESLTANETAGIVALDSYQIASRLSYFLWNTMPDEELFQLADEGHLTSLEVVRAQAARMLEDERARDTVADFYRQWLGTARFTGLARQVEDSESVGTFNAAWRESLARFVQHTFWDDGGNVESLLLSPAVFVDEPLGALYGLTVTGADASREPGSLSLANDPQRAGILTQPGLMALLAHPDQSAPVQRGKFVREQLLCHPLPPPPPDVDTSPPDPDPGATTRERFREHSANERCAQCHRLLDTVGFGFEAFDHLGRYRSDEYGIPVDTSGNVVDASDTNLEGEFDGAVELASKLAVSPVVESCLATQWFRYAMGRAEQNDDVCSLEAAKRDFSESGGDFRSLMISISTMDTFRYRPSDEQDY